MNKHVRRFISSLLLITLMLRPPIATSVQISKGLIGKYEVLIINQSGRLLWLEARTPRSARHYQLPAGGDVLLKHVKVIRVAGTDYPLEFKNRYALFWDEQGNRPYVMKLVMTK